MMHISGSRAPNFNESLVSAPSWGDLPGPILAIILSQCDEPTRDSASTVCRAFAEAVPLARRDDYHLASKRPGRWTTEALPTATELLERGCLKPHWKNIAKTMCVSAGGGEETLEQFYRRASRLADAHNVGDTSASGSFFDRCIGETAGEARDEFGMFSGPDGSYLGSVENGKPHGYGIYTWPDGGLYEGAWNDGCQNGYGVRTWRDGRRYEGELRNGMMDGHGIHTWTDESHYLGDWKANQQEGYGQYTYADGSHYEGEFVAGLQDGDGTHTWPSGSQYKGDWKAGQREGYGLMTGVDGSTYEGGWKEGKKDGRGVYVGPLGSYRGEWKAGRPESGVYTRADGRRLTAPGQSAASSWLRITELSLRLPL